MSLSIKDEQARKLADRFGFYLSVAQFLFSEQIFDEDRIVLRKARLSYCVDSYFVLNNAYKKWRMNDGHNTELPKVAALTSMVISKIRPFRAKDENDAQTREEVQCNAVFALALASVIMGVPLKSFGSEKTNSYYRILDFIDTSGSSTIDHMIYDLNSGENIAIDNYTSEITELDQKNSNALITIFELMQEINSLKSN